jgi:hypothetical protein
MGTLQRRHKSECRNFLQEHPTKPKDANDTSTEPYSDGPPSLRRAGSSIGDFVSSFYDENNNDGVISSDESPSSDIRMDASGLTVLFASLRISSYDSDTRIDGSGLTVLFATLNLLVEGVTADFCKNGLPWEGHQCRSKMAGLSGILYALPALVSPGHPYDQIMWTTQALVSVLADYCYICQDSFWHGVDRYFAIFNAITVVLRVYVVLSWKIALLAILPMACFVGANRAKNQKNLDAWHVWHCLWHVSGGPLVGLVVYMLHNCEHPDVCLEDWIFASKE